MRRRASSTGTAWAVAALLALVANAATAGAGEPGEVVWWDLVTEDATTAQRFYEELLGWSFARGESGLPVASSGGRALAAVVQITDQMPNASESQWIPAVLVGDLDAAVDRCRRSGGRVLREPITVHDGDRYAVVRDPQGAVLMFAETGHELGADRTPGSWVWAELWTDDPDGAATFYGSVLGYRTEAVDGPGGVYPVFSSGGDPRAGLLRLPSSDLRPAWAPYVAVADLAATAGLATELGGRVLVAPRADLAGGRVALLADPTGGAFFVYQLGSEVTP